MGEMADMLINQYYDDPDGYWENQYDDNYCSGYRSPKIIKCNKCGSSSVYWKQVPSGKWCLHNNSTGQPHDCSSVPRVGKNSNKKELTGYKLVQIKACTSCVHYYPIDKNLCIKHDYLVVPYGLCNDWKMQ